MPTLPHRSRMQRQEPCLDACSNVCPQKLRLLAAGLDSTFRPTIMSQWSRTLSATCQWPMLLLQNCQLCTRWQVQKHCLQDDVVPNHLQSTFHSGETIVRCRVEGSLCGVWCYCWRVCSWCDGRQKVQQTCQAAQACLQSIDEACLEKLPSVARRQTSNRHSPPRRRPHSRCFHEYVCQESLTELFENASFTLGAVPSPPGLSPKPTWSFSFLQVLSWYDLNATGWCTLHVSEIWSLGILLMTSSTMPATCPTTMPQCQNCLLITLMYMPTSCREASLSKLAAEILLGEFLLTKPLRRLSANTWRNKRLQPQAWGCLQALLDIRVLQCLPEPTNLCQPTQWGRTCCTADRLRCGWQWCWHSCGWHGVSGRADCIVLILCWKLFICTLTQCLLSLLTERCANLVDTMLYIISRHVYWTCYYM